MMTRPDPSRRLARTLPRRLGPAAALLALLCLGAPAAQADPAADLEKMVRALGYEVTPETKDVAAGFAVGNYNVGYSLSTDGTVVILSIAYEVTPAQRAKLPAREMLLTNASLTSAFNARGTAAGVNLVALNRTFLAAGLTPIALRQQVDALVGNATEYDKLLNPDNWK